MTDSLRGTDNIIQRIGLFAQLLYGLLIQFVLLLHFLDFRIQMINLSHLIKSGNGNAADNLAIFDQGNTIADKSDILAGFVIIECH